MAATPDKRRRWIQIGPAGIIAASLLVVLVGTPAGPGGPSQATAATAAGAATGAKPYAQKMKRLKRRFRRCNLKRTRKAKVRCKRRARRALRRARRAQRRGPRCAASVTRGLGTFTTTNRPGPCWRPYANPSPFNTPAGGKPERANSTAIVSRLLSGGPISYYVAGDPARDFGMAVYYSKPSDPLYTIECLKAWGTCDLEGLQIRLPAGAKPSGLWPLPGGDPWDSHLTIVDQQSGWEYDLWDVRSLPPNGGTIKTSWGGRTKIDGHGLNSDAVAARFGSMAGMIRAEKLRAGHIDHALTIDVPCTNGYTWPATKGGLECSDAGMGTANRLRMGSHVRLAMSVAEINSRAFPAWKRAILVALSRYGAYVVDTTGVEDQWSLNFESGAGYTSQGLPDPFVSLAKDIGIKREDYNGNGHGEYWFDVAGGVNWSRLKVLN